MLKPKIISIETRKCCHCGKTLYNKSEQFVLTQKLVVCSACWDGSKANPFNRVSTEPVANLVHFPDNSGVTRNAGAAREFAHNADKLLGSSGHCPMVLNNCSEGEQQSDRRAVSLTLAETFFGD